MKIRTTLYSAPYSAASAEVRHDYTYLGGQSYVVVDCETEDTVYEGGLDKRSSLDSVQQALFFAFLTGQRTRCRDLRYRRADWTLYRIRVACEMAGVAFVGTP